MLSIVAGSGAILIAFCGGDSTLKLGMQVACCVTMVAGLAVLRSTRNDTYGPLRFRIYGVVCASTVIACQAYLGVFSPCAIVVVTGLAFFAAGDDLFGAWLTSAIAIGGYFVMAIAMTAGRIPDRALISADVLTVGERWYFLAFVTVVYAEAARQARAGRVETVKAVRRLHDALAVLEEERAEGDLVVVRELQRRLMDLEAVQRSGACEIAGRLEPTSRSTGDFWMCQPLRDGRLLVVLGNAGGGGLPAAMLTAAVRGATEAAARVLGEALDPAGLVSLVDRSAFEHRERVKMTCLVGLLDTDTRQFRFASAGQRLPYLLRDGAARRVAGVVGAPLGERTGEPRESNLVQLRPDDRLVLVGEGVIASSDRRGAALGEERLLEVLSGANEPAARALVRTVFAHLESFTGSGRALNHDQCVLALSVGAQGGRDSVFALSPEAIAR